MRSGHLRLAELVAALSLATDLGTGHPFERALRTCLLAIRFGEALSLDEQTLCDCYYVALLRFVGCTASDHRASLFGDEIALGPQIDAVELWQPLEMLRFLVERVGEGEPPLQRIRRFVSSVPTGIRRSAEAAVAHCEVAQQIGGRLGLGGSVLEALGQLFERWDGGGVPGRARGEQLTTAARVVQIAQDAELFCRLGGPDAAVAVVRRRSGGLYDPRLAEQFLRLAGRLLGCLEVESVWGAVLNAEPGPRPHLDDAGLDQAIATIGDFADLRTPYSVGHSRAVADLAAGAARQCGLSADDVQALRRAGLLHDLGTTGISATIWLKAGPLNEAERERVRLHSYYTERILARSPDLATLGALAAQHHERLDGSGYHRGLPAAMLGPAARILATSEAYQAMIEERPYRPALRPEDAAQALGRDVRDGRLDGDAVRAVLAAAGHRVSTARRVGVAGLSEREIEVLRLLARGRTNRAMAQALTISERTVDHHIRHIYAKLGVSTRAAATLFAMQHHLVGEEPPAE
jgi:HD-GYP domain-containing protein (c-di-GMP phosphodiesterase class II)